MWLLLQSAIIFAVIASNIHWQWTPNGYLVGAIAVGTALYAWKPRCCRRAFFFAARGKVREAILTRIEQRERLVCRSAIKVFAIRHCCLNLDCLPSRSRHAVGVALARGVRRRPAYGERTMALVNDLLLGSFLFAFVTSIMIAAATLLN